MQLTEVAEHSQELAGFESYRQKLFGSAAAQSLGLRLLPTLTNCDLYAEGADVARLLAEAELALANIELFVPEAGASAENLRTRFQNIANACREATNSGGGVVIW